MPNTVLSPNMNITVPVNLADPYPLWGAHLQTALQTTIDNHDHSTGKGVQITQAGINITGDLTFAGFNATVLRSVRLQSQGANLALGSDVLCLYSVGGELWYNDAASRQVKVTNLGALNLAPLSYIVKSVTTSYTILAADLFQLFYCQTGTGAVAIALPSSATVAAGRVYYFSDQGQTAATNAITIAPNGADQINGVNAAVTITMSGAMAVFTNDGAGHWTTNFLPRQPLGQASASVALTTGAVTLSAAQVAAQTIRFTGTLTGNVTLVFPNSPGYFVCDFSAVVMGAFSVTIQSGSASTAALVAASIGSTQAATQLSFVATYGTNTIRVKA